MIYDGLDNLRDDTLLFLSHITVIRWEDYRGRCGQYIKETEDICMEDINTVPHVRRVCIRTQGVKTSDSSREWLMFSDSHDLRSDSHDPLVNSPDPLSASDSTRGTVSKVQIAFEVDVDNAPESSRIKESRHAKVFARLPTELQTNLGFLVDGPYRTNLNRENVPWDDDWNQKLVKESARLLVRSLRWLRDEHRLDAEVFKCLPLVRDWDESQNSFIKPLLR